MTANARKFQSVFVTPSKKSSYHPLENNVRIFCGHAWAALFCLSHNLKPKVLIKIPRTFVVRSCINPQCLASSILRDRDQLPPSRRWISRRGGGSTGLPPQATHRGHVGTWNFVADATVHGGTLRMLTVLDEHTKEVHILRPERRIGSADVIALVQAAITRHGAPEYIRSDNGAEFIAHDLQRWLADQHIKTIYITPASPWENGFVESFHSRFRDECLNREQLWTLTEARVVIEDFRLDYNSARPHTPVPWDETETELYFIVSTSQ